MLVTARAFQGGFAALLAPAGLSVLTTTFTEQHERGRAFAVYGAIAAGGGLVGLLLGGVLTEYLDWRWCLYVNLLFAAGAAAGAATLLPHHHRRRRAALDLPGVLTVSGAMFFLVYGLANAATHNWHTPSTWGFLTTGARARGALEVAAAVHGYTTALWWAAIFFAGGAVVCGALFRRGSLDPASRPRR
jgi:MFS family permease